MELKILKMSDSHLTQVLAIEETSFSTPWTGPAFLSECNENSFAYYIVCVNVRENEIVGYAGMWVIIDEVHITTIAVKDKYRGKKIGALLLEHLFQVARTKKARHVTLEVRPSNRPAQRLYERIGFQPNGRRKGYYQDNGEDAILMWKDI